MTDEQSTRILVAAILVIAVPFVISLLRRAWNRRRIRRG